jgi:hypothetical protein
VRRCIELVSQCDYCSRLVDVSRCFRKH